ncbi:phage tail assembly chaperone family protein, TAC [Acinetobacter calcoaceticus]|uniref:phage tail assembly chaperone family protein, TAC n=1 Tax=Acinetobacter calcoaceticus TaxID=471 RepID=UPI000FDC8163|nr:phage tail assembly chaperone family protein, TAC [Acinetobacter calcoaceticus]
MTKLTLDDIKSGALVDVPEKIDVEIMVKGQPRTIETFIKIMDYTTAIAQMAANKAGREGLASILADCIVKENGEPEFTEEQIRKLFNKPLIDAIWEKIVQKNLLGKVIATKKLSETKKSGRNSSSTASRAKRSLKQKETLVIESSASGDSTLKQEEA